MTPDLRMEPHEDYLEVVATEDYDLKDAVNQFQRILDACTLSGLNKVLIDFRAVPELPTGTERVLYAFDVKERYLRNLESRVEPLQIAYLGSALSTFQPGRDIVAEAGLPIALFERAKEALEWLGVGHQPDT